MGFRRLLLFSILTGIGSTLLAGDSPEILQPSNNKLGLLLVAEQGRATVEQPGGRRKQVRLRSQERLTDFAETRSGWAAVGTQTSAGKQKIIVLEQGAAGLERLPEPRFPDRISEASTTLDGHQRRSEWTRLARRSTLRFPIGEGRQLDRVRVEVRRDRLSSDQRESDRPHRSGAERRILAPDLGSLRRPR